jgi:ParB family chromosome partitioning protein
MVRVSMHAWSSAGGEVMATAALSPRVVLHSSDSNEWYTPAPILEAAHRVLGGMIDLDPASCEAANQVVQAQRFYTIADDGLNQPWHGRNVWLNPPYGKTGNRSNQDIWSQRLVQSFRLGHVGEAMLLVNAATDTAWFQALGREFPICLIAGRLKFWRPEVAADSPTHGNALIYMGPLTHLFKIVCKDLGIRAGTWPERAA